MFFFLVAVISGVLEYYKKKKKISPDHRVGVTELCAVNRNKVLFTSHNGLEIATTKYQVPKCIVHSYPTKR